VAIGGEECQQLVAPFVQSLVQAVPGALAGSHHFFFRLLIDRVQLVRFGYTGSNHPVAELHEAVKFFFPGQPFLAFIPFVAAAGTVAVGLGELGNVYQSSTVGGAHAGCKAGIKSREGRVVPAVYLMNLNAAGFTLLRFQALQCFTDAALRRLFFYRYGYSEPVIDNGGDHRYLKHTGSVKGFPEYAFRSGSIANFRPGNFVSLVAETLR